MLLGMRTTSPISPARLALAVSVLAIRASAQGFEARWDDVRAYDVRTAPDGRRYVADELLIGIGPDAARAAVVAAVEARGARVAGEMPLVRALRVVLPAGEDALAAAALYATIPGASYAEPNDVGEGGALGGPSDTFFATQWHLENQGVTVGTPGADIEVVPAWALLATPAPVVLAVLDSGIDFAHPELQARVVPGWDYVNEDSDATADHPHGIWCAGIAAAATDNGCGLAGVDATCTIYPLKVLNSSNGGTVADLVQALEDCAANQVDVVSMSLINYGGGHTLENGLALARGAGCILVACAGNGGIGNANVSGPGRSHRTISIGATDWDDARAVFSGTGSKLDFVAPGDGIATVSTSHADAWEYFTGCSAATPVSAGIVCLLKGQDPTLSHDEVFALLKAGAEDLVGAPSEDVPGRDDFMGWGRLNARRSVASLSPCPPPVAYGAGKPTSIGTSATVSPHGTPRRSFGEFAIDVDGAIPTTLAIVFHGPASDAQPWFGGTLLVGAPLVRLPARTSNALGHARFPFAIPPTLVGSRRFFQGWFRDPAHPDGTNVGTTSALDVVFAP